MPRAGAWCSSKTPPSRSAPSYKGRHTGNVGQLAALSFNGNKVVTTGGGGAVLTNDAALGQRAKHLTTTAACRTAGTSCTTRSATTTGCRI
ncbi:MAG: DegT/DnrJ/EryC1/StrS family aminotransferase [Rubrivivax sp.]